MLPPFITRGLPFLFTRPTRVIKIFFLVINMFLLLFFMANRLPGSVTLRTSPIFAHLFVFVVVY